MGQTKRIRLRAGLRDRLRQCLGATKVYALVGKSGTGKSFRAKLIAEKFNVDYIIDDGLLIHRTSIVAGKSAKRESLYMRAVRTALFDDPLHRHEVTKAIKSRKIRKILIIGTSERMVARAAEHLDLPPPTKMIFIEEVSSKEDIEEAQRSRNEEGKHIIPVPSLEVERNHPHLLSKSIKVLFKMGGKFGSFRQSHHKIYEKSVVQPPFQETGKGKVAISENAIAQMIAHCIDEFGNELILKKVRIRPSLGVYHIRAEVEVPYGSRLADNLHELREYVVGRIEKFTGIIIAEFNLIIIGISKPNRHWILANQDDPEKGG